MSGTRAFVEQLMGMPVSIHVRAVDPHRADVSTACRQVFTQLRRVEEVFSTWRADSEIMRMRRGELQETEAHPWWREVVGLGEEAQRRTGELFTTQLPDPATGGRHYDPTGLVKGWAVHAASAHLAELWDVAWCVNAGGDILAGTGRSIDPVCDTWRIGVEDPRQRGRIARLLSLDQGGVATSGAATRGAHVLDPRSQEWVSRDGSVTVQGPDLRWADVWATAGFVDPEATEELMRIRDPDYHMVVL